MKADNTRTMRTMFERWSSCAKWYSINFLKNGAKTHFVSTGIRIAMAIEATIGRPMSQPRSTLPPPESFPKSWMTLR